MPLNACLLFCTASGMNEVGVKAGGSRRKGVIEEERFFESWFER